MRSGALHLLYLKNYLAQFTNKVSIIDTVKKFLEILGTHCEKGTVSSLFMVPTKAIVYLFLDLEKDRPPHITFLSLK